MLTWVRELSLPKMPPIGTAHFTLSGTHFTWCVCGGGGGRSLAGQMERGIVSLNK